MAPSDIGRCAQTSTGRQLQKNVDAVYIVFSPSHNVLVQGGCYRAALSSDARAALKRVLYGARHILTSACGPLLDADTQTDLLPLMLQVCCWTIPSELACHTSQHC